MTARVQVGAEIDGKMRELVVEVREMQLMQDGDGNAVVLLVDYAASCDGKRLHVPELDRPDLEAAVERAIEGICS